MLGLSGLALAGVGAAITSANLNDQVSFQIRTYAANFDLQGCGPAIEEPVEDAALAQARFGGYPGHGPIDLDDVIDTCPETGSAWYDEGALGEAVPIDVGDIGALLPGETKYVKVTVLNAGDTDMKVLAGKPTGSGPMFETSASVARWHHSDGVKVGLVGKPYLALEPDEEGSFIVKIRAPKEWSEEFVDSEGWVSLLVTGMLDTSNGS
ncbi:hypothetical protein [Demequina silvatica]|uniref:hypothetical protein n=1 Tax=Demequina silvatica TaxID=1638988 RepID=UPI0007849E50|nr:hypothetical protein [Demequina silvatica]